MMKRLLYVLAAAGLLAAVSCRKQPDTGRAAEVRELYEKSIEIGMLYTDSLKHAKDSDAVYRLSKDFDDRIAKLQYGYPPDTGLEISEGENDTLTNMTLRIIELRDSLLKGFASTLKTDSDSANLNLPEIPDV